MKPSESLDEFLKLYWDDLTPEHINYLSQTKDEVAKLERKLDAAQKTIDFAEVVAKRLEIDIVDYKSELQQAQAELAKENESRIGWLKGYEDVSRQLEQSRQREAELQKKADAYDEIMADMVEQQFGEE